MMVQEFTALTGYEPSEEEYKQIEEIYYEFPGDKESFAKAWLGLFGYKAEKQQSERKAKADRIARRLDAEERFTLVLNTDYGAECNSKAHAVACAGIELLQALQSDRTSIDIEDGFDGAAFRGAVINLGLEGKGFSVLTCCDLHCVEWSDKEVAYKVLDYLIEKSSDDYEFALSDRIAGNSPRR